jgi:hypothetical protein
VVALAVACALQASPCLAQGTDNDDSFAAAVMGGDPSAAIRYRFENVDEDGFDNAANASTVRLRLNYKTDTWRNWTAFTEFDYVAHLIFRNFNSGAGTSPNRTEYPVVADPKGADLNQFYLDYTGVNKVRMRFGRQRILLDNQRFVGGVGWRQNEQTYDGVSVSYDPTANNKIFYSYIGQVNRIFGERSAAGQNSTNTHLLNGRFALGAKWNLSPYLYYIDNDDVPAFSTSTIGARLTGSVPIGESSLAITAEYASQEDVANAPVSYRADYAHVTLDFKMSKAFTFGFGFESLGGDEDNPGEQFRTPLATLHAFQGWADKFLATPNAGINDVYGKLSYQHQKWKLTAVYHDLTAQDGDAEWGTELDLSLGRKLGDRYGILLKGAFFSADDPAYTDTTKLWLQLTAAF